MRTKILIGMLVVSMGCGKSSSKDSAVEGLVADAKDVVLPQVRAAIASGKLEDAPPCSRVLANLDTLERGGDHAEVVADIRQVCEHDINVAHMKRAIEAAEVARTAEPDEKVLRECFNGELTSAVQRLEKAKRVDEPAKALLARFAVACPGETP